MSTHICAVVPPYLLRSISESSENPQHVREAAKTTLDSLHQQMQSLTGPLAPRNLSSGSHQSIVPEHLLQNIANSDAVDEATRANARRDLQHIQETVNRYQQLQGTLLDQHTPSKNGLLSQDATEHHDAQATVRTVFDAHGSDDESELPGTQVRAEGQKPVDDKAVNEAFDNIGLVLEMYKQKFNWISIDNHNMRIVSSVHFGQQFQNAYWDPARRQMVFGDGGDFLWNFPAALDVIGHELTHAVTENTSPLFYHGQSGALNEHVSDVFGIMAKQIKDNTEADEADWLIGEDCLMPRTKGVALRSMKDPGTAYDDPRFGKDPQPANFRDFDATDFADNGGVHKYSGIPNRAFYLVATAFGGFSYEKAGQIWWNTMNSGHIPTRCEFRHFAEVTVNQAQKLFGAKGSKIVTDAWSEVGVAVRSQ
ncbi:hypothetical protein G7054_g12372 [Neopestalotiopsis clavispora]|nr:hypothetical protein G7054_g12372 [Neopestalotiopsis clavispora]